MTSAIYPNVVVAMRRAFSTPRVNVRAPLAVAPGPYHDVLTSDERIAQDRMVQQIVLARFKRQPFTVMVLRAVYEEDNEVRSAAQFWLAKSFQRPGRASPVA